MIRNIPLLQEEKRSTIIFLLLFYIVYFAYDIMYYNYFPLLPWSSFGTVDNQIWHVLNLLKYIYFIILIPIFIYYIKKEKPEKIKYVLIASYVLLNILTEFFYYVGTPKIYNSGNLVELVIILFSPIFVNKRFTLFVVTGVLLKHAFLGIVLQDILVVFPIMIYIVVSFIAFILLLRFLKYVKAIKISHDEQMQGIVKGFISTLELKDPYTRGHSERVALYAVNLAKATGKFTEDELRNFYYACLLHDIGKVNIPDAILTKPGRLTDEEYEIIKTHPVVGAEALRGVQGIDENIDVILYHHERWDGKGYPEGLVGKQTPFLARITAIADAFDAMTSSRSYRAALPFEEAYNRIMAGKGSQFDPHLVDIFDKVFPEWVKIAKEKSK
ncbi:HD-GYP domain-containing protein [Pallidibacillus thermolactis]|jgi:putative nucleotidyltransferase with HDIG domain|uniref:HD-GYP domain-containing protein n=1 Tax=Pallidibacillus thermolactis TaxID=251051 RepID=UPI002EB7DC14|nr:HD-GYP domain-containing protein [Pallidibacillus thermolactis subsp. kokeshiiformis]